MVGGNLCKRTLKEGTSAQPFIDDGGKRVLVTRLDRHAPQLLRRHIGNGTGHSRHALGARTMGYNGNTKISEQNLVVAS